MFSRIFCTLFLISMHFENLKLLVIAIKVYFRSGPIESIALYKVLDLQIAVTDMHSFVALSLVKWLTLFTGSIF